MSVEGETRRGGMVPNSLCRLFPGFFWTSGLSLWASDFYHLLAHCLVSQKVSVEHSVCW